MSETLAEALAARALAWLAAREAVEDCSCADEDAGRCWYHLNAQQKAEARKVSLADWLKSELPAAPPAPGARSPEPSEAALDALEDMWWQHAYPVDGHEARHTGGLSSNELAEEVLEAAGRITRVEGRADKEWYRLTTPAERAALPARAAASTLTPSPEATRHE